MLTTFLDLNRCCLAGAMVHRPLSAVCRCDVMLWESGGVVVLRKVNWILAVACGAVLARWFAAAAAAAAAPGRLRPAVTEQLPLALCAPRVGGIKAVLAAVTGCSWIVPLVVAPVAAAQQPGRKLQRAALADAVVRDGAAVVQLLARVGQVLVAKLLAVLLLHLAFDSADGV